MNRSIGLFTLTSILLIFSGMLIVVINAAPTEGGKSAASDPLATMSTPRPPPASATPIEQDFMASMNDLLFLGRANDWSSYDASYRDLAMRHGLPIATVDQKLTEAARRMKVPILVG